LFSNVKPYKQKINVCDEKNAQWKQEGIRLMLCLEYTLNQNQMKRIVIHFSILA